jgi:serine/threonine-protein kinase
MVGQLIGGRYRITGVLGEGGMGIVYVGEQPMGTTIRKVAIKTLHPHLSKDPSVLARFHRECGTVAQLEHPNTIKFFDFGTTDDQTLYIVMEFVAGRALSEVLVEEGRLAPDRVIRIMRQVSGALDEAHNQGIIHRDLKPENIILTNRAGEVDVVKVLDFGIAGRTESTDAQKEQKLTQQGMVLGTPPYMSPEQFTGAALDRRSDIYSLAIMAYEMLTGRLPFEADTPWQWATQHMTAQPTPLELAAGNKSIPEGMRAAIMRGLSKDREERQNTARQFFEELSGGARLTVEQLERAATAAMEIPPDFGPAAVAATAAMPQQPAPPGAGFAPQPAAAAPAGPAPVIAAPPPPAASRGGGGKWLVPVLGGVGALLALAIVIVVARSGGTDEEQPLPVASAATTTSAGPTNIESEFAAPAPDPGSTGATATPTPVQPDKTPPSSGIKASPSPSTGGTGASGQPKAPSTPSTPDTNKTPKKSDSSGGSTAACDACVAAAQGSDIVGASRSYRSCSDAAGKKRCSFAVSRKASGLAHAAALNGQCAQAQAIIAAAQSMGVGGKRLTGALDNTSCKK